MDPHGVVDSEEEVHVVDDWHGVVDDDEDEDPEVGWLSSSPVVDHAAAALPVLLLLRTLILSFPCCTDLVGICVRLGKRTFVCRWFRTIVSTSPNDTTSGNKWWT